MSSIISHRFPAWCGVRLSLPVYATVSAQGKMSDPFPWGPIHELPDLCEQFVSLLQTERRSCPLELLHAVVSRRPALLGLGCTTPFSVV